MSANQIHNEQVEPRVRASRVGQELAGKYRITRTLGEGGMGAVYEALHEVIQRRFAIKFLHPELAQNPDILARFRREATTAGSVEQENIAAITDFGTADDGSPFIVMEFLDGQDLAHLLARDGALPVPRAVNAIVQACRGLEVVHARGITHRDLKPANLFVVRRGDGSDLVKVLDFGIAKLRTPEGGGASTRTGATIGTPYYMPPEQARGRKDIDERADIYALGVILYELLSGQKPHPGDSYNEILFHILTKTPAPLEQKRSGLPPALCDVIRRAMASEPGDRFAKVADLGAALLPFAGAAGRSVARSDPPPAGIAAAKDPTVASEPSAASVPAMSRTFAATPAAKVAEIPRVIPSATPATPAPAEGSRRLPFVLGAVALCALVGGFALKLSSGRASPNVEADPAMRPAAVATSTTNAAAPQVSAAPSAAASAAASADTAERPAGQPSPAPSPSAAAAVAAKPRATASAAVARPTPAPAPSASALQKRETLYVP